MFSGYKIPPQTVAITKTVSKTANPFQSSPRPHVQTLFPDADLQTPQPQVGFFAGVAMEQSIDRVLDYSVPKRLAQSIHVGQRVRVPLGRNNRPAHGYVVYLRDTSDYPKIKDLIGIDDDRVLLNPKLMELA